MENLQDRLIAAERIINEPSFLKNKGLGNEVGYYIFTYPAEDELIVRAWIGAMQDKYAVGSGRFQIVVFDLYDIMVDILTEKGFLDKCFEFEQKKGLDRLTKAVGNTLRITSEDGLILNYIRDRAPEHSVLFLTGIGKCYPLLRSHTVLNNLHQVIDNVPVVMFYPGKYDGQELVLFNEIKDDNYYRAFRLVD